MPFFSKKPTKSRCVTDIVCGLTAIVQELGDSISYNEAKRDETADDRQAEDNRHASAIVSIGARETNLDEELIKANTIRNNLSSLLDIN